MGSVALLRRPGIALLTCSLALTSVLALATGGAASAAGRSAAPADVAPGAPGAPAYFDLARKDCVGTATGRGSRVWYTVAGGVLSDVYAPPIDNTNVSTLQYIVTDGSTFTDLQTRDMTYTVTADHHLHHRPGQGHGADANCAEEPARVRHQRVTPAPVCPA